MAEERSSFLPILDLALVVSIIIVKLLIIQGFQSLEERQFIC